MILSKETQKIIKLIFEKGYFLDITFDCFENEIALIVTLAKSQNNKTISVKRYVSNLGLKYLNVTLADMLNELESKS